MVRLFQLQQTFFSVCLGRIGSMDGKWLRCSVVSDSMDCSLLGLCVRGILQARILERGCHFLHQGIFSTRGSNPCLLHLLRWQADSLALSRLGSLAMYHFAWMDGCVCRGWGGGMDGWLDRQMAG